MEINIVFVLGGPGCGKSTLCRLLSKKFNIIHIPIGEIFMHEVKKKSEIGNIIAEYIKKAVIVPPKITFDMIMDEISKYNNNIFLIDGYPRNDDNYRYFLDNHPDNMVVKRLIYLECAEDVMIERVIKRQQSIDNRIDNDIDIIKKRIVVFNQQTMPIIEDYKEKGKLIVINSAETIDKIIENLYDQWQKIDLFIY